jgi:DNA processing protein
VSVNEGVNTEVSESAVALAGLLRVCEPPSAALTLFVRKVGPVAAWRGVLTRRAPRAVLAATAARTQDVAADVLIRRAEEDLAVAARSGARVIGPADDDWPADAVESFQGALARGVRGAGPPFALYVRGRSLARCRVTG